MLLPASHIDTNAMSCFINSNQNFEIKVSISGEGARKSATPSMLKFSIHGQCQSFCITVQRFLGTQSVNQNGPGSI